VKNISGRNIYVRSKFSEVRSSHELCALANAYSLEGTLVCRRHVIRVNARVATRRRCRPYIRPHSIWSSWLRFLELFNPFGHLL